MFAPARMPVAEGKKMENMPKKLPSGPRQPGTKLAAKMSAVKGENGQFRGELVCYCNDARIGYFDRLSPL